MPKTPVPPAAPRRDTELTVNGDTRIDPWYWLREKDNPEVIELLEAENSYTTSVLSHTQSSQQRLYDEMVARIQETDLSVPVKKGPWWYYVRTQEGRQYPIHCRKPDVNGEPGDESTEQIILDENVQAGDAPFYSLGVLDLTFAADLMAYGEDRDGDEVFTLRFRSLVDGSELDDVIEQASYATAWSKDASVFFYVRRDEAMRPYQVWRHVMGTSTDEDTLIFQEDDERFNVGIGNTKTEDYIVVMAASSLTSEIRFLPSDDPMGEPQLFDERRTGIEYHVSHHRDDAGERFYVVTNEDALNFKLMVAPSIGAPHDTWDTVIPNRDDVKLDGVEVTKEYLILSERAEANSRIAVLKLDEGTYSVLQQDEPVYSAHTSGNAEFDTTLLRYEYTSLVTPRTVYELNLATGQRRMLKQQPVLGDFDPTKYVSERLWATSNDGTKVPISIVYRRDRKDEPGPTLLYGYGSYEITIDPTFSSLRLSLLDRGFAFAIAHVRGGGDLGRAWYENGKFLSKKNTFYDFIACAEHLIEIGITSTEQLVIRGGSAGGLLMGAVVNLRPELFAAVVAEVPFVDSLTTMLDTSLPLTVGEFEEWGNPQEPEYYTYMKSYAPYENVKDTNYPAMLVTAGLNDPRVSYWEPAKWVQRLREHNTGNKEILLKTEMGAGHMGPSGRYDAWRDEAFVYAFMFHALGLKMRF